MRFALVDQAKKDFPVHRLCQVLGVSQSGYFAWKEPPGQPATARRHGDAGACPLGVRPVERHLRQPAHDARACRMMALHRAPTHRPADARERPAWPAEAAVQTHHRQPEHAWPIAPEHHRPGLHRRRRRTRSGAWTSRTSGRGRDGSIWPSSSTCSPAASSAGQLATGCTANWRWLALRKALVMRRPPQGLIHHSDRGSQYCSVDYQAELHRHSIRISMSGKGNCYDNAMVETFFKTIKSELVWRTVFYTRAQAEQTIARYIDGFYNPDPAPLCARLHQSRAVRANRVTLSKCLSI